MILSWCCVVSDGVKGKVNLIGFLFSFLFCIFFLWPFPVMRCFELDYRNYVNVAVNMRLLQSISGTLFCNSDSRFIKVLLEFVFLSNKMDAFSLWLLTVPITLASSITKLIGQWNRSYSKYHEYSFLIVRQSENRAFVATTIA